MKNKFAVLLIVFLSFCLLHQVVKADESLFEIERSMVFISGGSFSMGSPQEELNRDDDEQVHEVSVSSFSLSRYEVTKGQFARFVEETAYVTDAEKNQKNKTQCREYNYEDKWKLTKELNWRNATLLNKRQGSANHPVVCVSWNDANAYIAWLNKVTDKFYRLPTEAEFEYVSRGGSKSRFEFGEDENRLCDYANIADRTKLKDGSSWRNIVQCNDGQDFTNEVGQYKPNLFGIYDINGNVWEWTCSAFDESYEKGYELGCVSGDYFKHISVRGGAYGSEPRYVRSANRMKRNPHQNFANSGFRLASGQVKYFSLDQLELEKKSKDFDINWEQIFVPVLTLFLIGFFTKKASSIETDGELKFGFFMKGLGMSCLLLSIIPLIMLLTKNYQFDDSGETAAIFFLIIFFGIAAFYCFIEAFYTKGSYDKTSINFTSFWTGEKNENWENLESIHFNSWLYCYVLKFQSGKVIRLSSYLLGHKGVLDLVDN